MLSIKEKLAASNALFNNMFLNQLGFKIEDTTFNNIVDYLHKPTDSSSLAVTRILFGKNSLVDKKTH